MRKIIALFLTIAQLVLITPKSIAAFDGCPNQWPLPKNLLDATQEQIKTLWSPDFNTIITPSSDSQYSFDGKNWNTFKKTWINIVKPEQASVRNYDVDTLMSFFGSQWEDVTLIKFGDLSWLKQKNIYIKTTINVTKKGCESPVSFYYEKQYFPPGVQTLSFSEEITKFKERFSNFQSFDSALSKYESCLTKWKNYANSKESRKPLDDCYLGNINFPFPVMTKLIPNEPGCLEFLPGNANLASTVGIKSGSNCSYSVIGFLGDNYVGALDSTINSKIPTYYDAVTDKIVVFATIKIATKPNTSTIVCAKGKLLKKITGINPKCPSGYAQKR